MITISDAANSCGLKLLGGETLYKTPETYFKDLAGKFFSEDKTKIIDHTARWRKMALADHTQFIYSHQPSKFKIGTQIKEYIEQHGLGTVIVSELGNNPVHDSKIAVWVWTRDNKAFETHCIALLTPPKKEEQCPIFTEPQIAELTNSLASVNSHPNVQQPFVASS